MSKTALLPSGGGDEGFQFLHQLTEFFQGYLLRAVVPPKLRQIE